MILPTNRMVVFRQDMLSYTYRACGSGAALQVQLVTQSNVPNTRDLRVVTVPSQLMNDHQVMVRPVKIRQSRQSRLVKLHERSMACHYPGNVDGRSGYWAVSTGRSLEKT